jgi:hypothetical protein
LNALFIGPDANDRHGRSDLAGSTVRINGKPYSFQRRLGAGAFGNNK